MSPCYTIHKIECILKFLCFKVASRIGIVKNARLRDFNPLKYNLPEVSILQCIKNLQICSICFFLKSLERQVTWSKTANLFAVYFSLASIIQKYKVLK